MNRIDGREFNELRPIKITRNFNKFAEGSVLIEMGETKVICTASIEDKVPPFQKGTGKGWITSEYGMLPRATETRNPREVTKGRPSITGSFIALADALNKLVEKGDIPKIPLKGFVAAVSVGIVDGNKLLDLSFQEDSNALVDMNVVMTDKGEIVEIQGTGEGGPFTKQNLSDLLSLAEYGIEQIIKIQKEVLYDIVDKIGVDSVENNNSNQQSSQNWRNKKFF